MLGDSPRRYGAVTKLFHWLMALLFVQQFAKLGDRINDGEHWVGDFFGPWHGFVGTLVLTLVVFRLMWAFSQRRRRPPHEGPSAFVVKAGHAMLYLFMVLLPLTGIMYMLGYGYGLKFLSVPLVDRTGEQIDWLVTLGSLHGPASWLFLLTIFGHVAAALFHHFIFRDEILRRMI